MQFLVLAYDAEDALERRKLAREEHLKLGDKMKAEGSLLYAAALLNDEGDMAGSAMVVEFASQEDISGWLDIEPYVQGHVWENVEIVACKVGPSFLK
jgi:uncharacterized protein YciI